MNKKFKFLNKEGYTLLDNNKDRKGGNGQVLFVEKNEEKFALKYIEFKKNSKKKKRTQREIAILDSIKNLEGIIPLVDYKIEYDYAWYTMPIAEPLNVREISQKPIIQIIKELKFIAETIKMLHEMKIYHRDIKPENLLYYAGKICLSDFGLVIYPDAVQITKEYEKIGPWTTIAPENKRGIKNIDNSKSDVYSFAKTIWILLTGQDKSFDGQYSYKDSMIRLLSYREDGEPLAILDNMLIQATENQPENRQDMDFIIKSLDKFLGSTHSEKTNYEWEFISKILFPYGVPTTSIWRSSNDIVQTLKELTYFDNLNHIFFGSGGLDLIEVTASKEDGFIELNCDGIIHKLKPKALRFETFENNEWNYFLLELDTVQEIIVSGKKIKPLGLADYEEVVEIEIGKYIPLWCEHYGRDMTSDNKEKFSKDARTIAVCLNGKYLLCNKKGPYNRVQSTYNGYQNYFHVEDFRKFVDLAMNDRRAFDIAQKIVHSKIQDNEKVELFEALVNNRYEYNSRILEIISEKDIEDASYIKESKIELTDKDIQDILNEINLEELTSNDSILYKLSFNFDKNIFKNIAYVISGDIKFKKQDFFDILNDYDDKYIDKVSVDIIFNQVEEIKKKINLVKEEFTCRVSGILVKDISDFNLISIEELDAILKNGDSFVNNTLVIDRLGKVRLLKTNENKLEISLSPIQINSFKRYQNDVGEYYSEGNSNSLNRRYEEYLNYCYEFLKSQTKVSYVDYWQESKDILEEIQIILNKTT